MLPRYAFGAFFAAVVIVAVMAYRTGYRDGNHDGELAGSRHAYQISDGVYKNMEVHFLEDGSRDYRLRLEMQAAHEKRVADLEHEIRELHRGGFRKALFTIECECQDMPLTGWGLWAQCECTGFEWTKAPQRPHN